jgi:hypothetical protein
MRTALALVLASAGCAKQSSTSHTPEAASYRVGQPGDGWRPQSAGSADHAWVHRDISGTIYTSSACGKRYEDGRLEDLARHLTFGIARGDAIRVEHTRLDDRAALLSVWQGALDGIAVQVGTVVTKKNACLYDLLYLAPPQHFDTGWPDFIQVMDGFATSPR